MTRSLEQRLVLSIPAGFLALLIYAGVHESWRNYWLMADGVQGTAVILEEHSHGGVDYKYNLDDEEYTGRSQRNRDRPKKPQR